MKKLVLSIFTAGMLFNVASISDTCAMYDNDRHEFNLSLSCVNNDINYFSTKKIAKSMLKRFGMSLVTTHPDNDETISVDSFINVVNLAINNQVNNIQNDNNSKFTVEEYLHALLNATVIDNSLTGNYPEVRRESKTFVSNNGTQINVDAREYIFYRVMNFAAANNINLADISPALSGYHNLYRRETTSYVYDIADLYLAGNLRQVITQTSNRIANFFNVQIPVVAQTPVVAQNPNRSCLLI